MRRSLVCIGVLGLLVASLAGCSRENVAAPGTNDPIASGYVVDPELVAGELVQLASWRIDPDVEFPPRLADGAGKAGWDLILDCGREELPGDVARYWWDISTGEDSHDVVRLHRVVKERRPYRPIRTREAVFVLPGGAHFVFFYLPGLLSADAPDDWGMAHFLAANNVDVWGFDPPETLVPVDCTDFTFMADWDMRFVLDRIRVGLAVSRFTRLLTGNGFGKMTLLGYQHSGFGMAGYALLNDETQRPEFLRHVDGFVSIEVPFKVDHEPWREFYCEAAAERAASLAAGQYHSTKNLEFQYSAVLTLTDPDGPSPLIPGFTNRGASLFLSAMTWMAGGYPEPFHYYAGVFGSDGLPLDLQHTPFDLGLEVVTHINPYRSMAYSADIAALRCDEVDLPYDDHLAEITVPVMAVGGGGGFGHLVDDTTSLLGSTDVTVLDVSLDPQMMFDYGNQDVLWAANAPELVFQPVLEWIEGHSCREAPEVPRVAASASP